MAFYTKKAEEFKVLRLRIDGGSDEEFNVGLASLINEGSWRESEQIPEEVVKEPLNFLLEMSWSKFLSSQP